VEEAVVHIVILTVDQVHVVVRKGLEPIVDQVGHIVDPVGRIVDPVERIVAVALSLEYIVALVVLEQIVVVGLVVLEQIVVVALVVLGQIVVVALGSEHIVDHVD
jgi:hypothetical protein